MQAWIAFAASALAAPMKILADRSAIRPAARPDTVAAVQGLA
jgi:hypothetical protein